eukprot:TRINITY_DN16840_c0_g1_i1.p1 TRINITY_DN16840_c0_g1~~TRINITY_DN16840_c0_g1_i1.p1  ORF type:complete len:604 (+),score=115.56 TRINITY_DN16840_c0_g1_i1:3-1814(+)
MCTYTCFSHKFTYLFFFFQAEDGIRDLVRSRGLGDVYKRQVRGLPKTWMWCCADSCGSPRSRSDIPMAAQETLDRHDGDTAADDPTPAGTNPTPAGTSSHGSSGFGSSYGGSISPGATSSCTPGEASVLVGPVIGAVSDTSARVLLEVSASQQVEMVLTPQEAGAQAEVVRVRLNMHPKTPQAFAVEGLSAATEYGISFNGVAEPEKHTGRLRTFRTDMCDLKVISGSCDHPKNRGAVDMWAKMLEDWVSRGEVDIVVHNGDQVYADAAYNAGLRFWQNHPQLSDEVKIHEVSQLYAEIYRSTWNHPPTKALLGSVSNLMLWDDHELRNDWGAFDKDRDQSSVNYKLGKAARRAYWWYQRQLWDGGMEDMEAKEAEVRCDGHVQLLPGGKIGFIFVDSRGSRSFYADDERPFVSGPQWSMLCEALNPEAGPFQHASKLFLVHSMPCVLIGTSCSRACACLVGGKDKMGFGVYPDEQEEYLQLIDTWVHHSSAAPNREVLLLGGDLHFSMQTVVSSASTGVPVMRQVVTSAVSNKPPCCFQYYPMKWLAQCCSSLGKGSYSYVHDGHNPVQNFVVFSVDVEHDIQIEVVSARDVCCNTRGLCYC